MIRIAAAALCTVASVGFAQMSTPDTTKTPGGAKANPGTTMGETKGMGAKTGMMWTPRKVTHEDKKGIEAMLKQVDDAWKKGDLVTAASMVDFPVYMVTDDSKGNVTTDTWTKDKYMTEMSEAMKFMPKDIKMKHNRKYDFLTDTMAMIYDNMTMTMGKQTTNVRSAALVIKRDGKWLTKSMMEGGWGDVTKAKEPKG